MGRAPVTDPLVTLGCLLVGGLFVFAGADHFRRFALVRGMLAARGWTRPGLWLALGSAFEAVAGLCVMFGVLRAPAAFGLGVFVVVASVRLLDFWRFQGPEREGMRAGFMTNWAVLGGLLLAAAAG